MRILSKFRGSSRVFAFDERTGLLALTQQKPYYAGENIVAVPDSCEPWAAWRTAP
jgi:hypothetical protein